MTALLARITADPDLFAAAIFGGAMLVIAISVALWVAVFGRDERRMHRRIERVQSPATSRSEGQAPAVDSVKRQRKDSSIASLDRLLKRALPNGNVMRLRLERSGLRLAVGDYLLICLGLGIATTLAMVLLYDLALPIDLSVGVLVGLGCRTSSSASGPSSASRSFRRCSRTLWI
jgi:Flp pilus assembly protein TadB